MRVVRFEVDGLPRYGIADGMHVRALGESPFLPSQSARALEALVTGERYRLAGVRLLPPCEPTKYIGVGLNYRATAAGLNMKVPDRPLLFLKPSTSILAPEAEVLLPRAPRNVVCEGELAVVIGAAGRDIGEADARNHILGFCATNDLTDVYRFENAGGNPTTAKALDTFAPLGPWIETDFDPERQIISTMINGREVQRGSVADMIFSVSRCVSFISHLMTLLPGDVIATGSPSAPAELKPGDRVEVGIEGIGSLANRVESRG